MECKLCKKEFLSLQQSHIIPEWMYKPIYSKNKNKNIHKLIEINPTNFNKLKPVQKGYREALLCKSCEEKLSRWEGKAKKNLEDISSRTSKYLKITKLNSRFTLVENINYDYFKKFILSILWRMSVCSLSQFKDVKLGVYEESLRILLNDNTEIGTFNYPILVHQLQLEGKYYKDIIMGVEKGRIQNKYIFQSFVAYGYMFEIVTSNLNFPQSASLLLLNENGSVIIESTDIMSLQHDNALLKRINDVDVIGFYNKA